MADKSAYQRIREEACPLCRESGCTDCLRHRTPSGWINCTAPSAQVAIEQQAERIAALGAALRAVKAKEHSLPNTDAYERLLLRHCITLATAALAGIPAAPPQPDAESAALRDARVALPVTTEAQAVRNLAACLGAAIRIVRTRWFGCQGEDEAADLWEEQIKQAMALVAK